MTRAVTIRLLPLLLARLLVAQRTPADRVVEAAFRRAAPSVSSVSIARRLPATPQSDLVLAFGGKQAAGPGSAYLWSSSDRLGLFLQDRSGQVQTLLLRPGPNNDCSAAILRLTARELVLSCTGEKWATYDNQKFVYDPASPLGVRHFSYPPFSAARIVGGAGPQFVMSDRHQLLLVALDAEGRPAIVPATPALAVLSAIPLEDSTVGDQAFRTPAPEPDPVTSFGPAGAFHLDREPNVDAFDHLVIRNRLSRETYPLPQSNLRDWRNARPDEAKERPDVTPDAVSESLGPHQLEGNRLWFGKTFYNGEGETGVGGFGYFDAATRTFRMFSPPQIHAWSVSAILVEPDAVWLALYHRGEYGNIPGGVLRWDRGTKRVERFPVPAVVTGIARSGEDHVLATVDGLARVHGRQISGYFIDRTEDGRYQIAERN